MNNAISNRTQRRIEKIINQLTPTYDKMKKEKTEHDKMVNDLNDIITYTLTVENTGNVTLTSLTLSDTLKDSNGNILATTNGGILLLKDNELEILKEDLNK